MAVDVLVYGHTKDSEPFWEEPDTRVLNAHGALITLAADVRVGQKLILTNIATREEQECRVVHLGEKYGHKTEVGIEFVRAAPKFWAITFPPNDWRRVER